MIGFDKYSQFPSLCTINWVITEKVLYSVCPDLSPLRQEEEFTDSESELAFADHTAQSESYLISLRITHPFTQRNKMEAQRG